LWAQRDANKKSGEMKGIMKGRAKGCKEKEMEELKNPPKWVGAKKQRKKSRMK